MKPKKTSEGSEKKLKVKAKSGKSPRIESQSKSSLLAADRICNRCKVHGMINSIKGHKCPEEVRSCDCPKCLDYVEKTRRKNENRKRRQLEKNAGKEKPKVETKSKVDSKSFVNSLKNKSKKILNSNKKKGRPPKVGADSKSATKKTPTNQAVIYSDNPPSLQPQTSELIAPEEAVDVIQTSSSTDVNQSNKTDTEPEVAKSSAPLCARYLKCCEELSRQLSKYQLNQDEMIACFKYSIIRDCLGNVELAAQKIAYASQEIRLGAVYNIQHPSEEQMASRPSASGQEQVLCSTYNAQYVPNSGVHYSPSFTPIRRK